MLTNLMNIPLHNERSDKLKKKILVRLPIVCSQSQLTLKVFQKQDIIMLQKLAHATIPETHDLQRNTE